MIKMASGVCKRRSVLNSIVFLLLSLEIVSCQLGTAKKCYEIDTSPSRCMPEFVNAAYLKNIYSNNTCGMKKPSYYCVQSGVIGLQKTCQYCDNSKKELAHPARLMNDYVGEAAKDATWWQSETLLENKNRVRIILDLGKTFEITYIRITFHSPRPQSFAIYKRTSTRKDAKWIPFQYYSETCKKTYGISENAIVPKENQKLALCSSKYSKITPLSGGNVAFSTLEGRPDRYGIDSSPVLQEWVTVSSLKIELDRMSTFGDEVFGDQNVLRSYYYAISNLVVGGRCKCNGHASECIEGVTGAGARKFLCKCEHNTAGDDCEKCQPLYNDRPWARATRHTANPCAPCNCNGLADSCVFDLQLYRLTGRGGRCVACKNNTDGANCERCKVYHYRKFVKEACKPCQCNPVGSRRLQCNSDGQCSCQPGVYGQKCDKCRPGYFGFSKTGCRPCRCSSAGSLSENCDAIGQCRCKDNVIGQKCDQCKAQHFDLESSNVKGCKPCFCYGHGIACSSRLGFGKDAIVSNFKDGLEGWKVENYAGVDFASASTFDVKGHQIRVTAPVTGEVLYLVSPPKYLGNRLSSYGKKFTFLMGVTEVQDGWNNTRKDFILEGSGLKAEFPINAQGNGIPRARFELYSFTLVEPKGMSPYLFQRLLTNLSAIKIRMTFGRTIGVIDMVTMETTKPVSLNSPEQVTWLEQCKCQVGYTGIQCEKCDHGYTRANSKEGKHGKCVLCNCNNHAKECHPETGECKCQDNTTGKNCEKCRPGFYGYATNGQSDDCKPCPCVFGSQCIYVAGRVHCTDCPQGHEGDRCERCKDGYFGDPEGKKGPKTGCKPCNCSGNIDKNALGNCDQTTGECLKCIYNTKNGALGKCEKCKDGYYGDALALPKGQCKPCNCFVNGTVWPPGVNPKKDLLPCDSNGQCQCRDMVIGKNCSSCPPKYWNVASGNGCETCRCNAVGSVDEFCDVKTGQCNCKEGVADRQCAQCAPGHYSFSKRGCKSCNCNKFGSVNINCTELGVCHCRPGVLGVKCDQCPENKYNLSVGCISCPQCYFLVQRKVHELREKLIRLKASVGEAKLPQNFTIKNKNFVVALKKIEVEAGLLSKKVTTLKQGDRDLNIFFQKLLDEFALLKQGLSNLKIVLKTAFNDSEMAKTDISDAEEIIEQIKNLLNDARYQLDTHGMSVYEEALKLAKDISDLAKKMKSIAAEAKKLADRHTDEASKIKKTSAMAYQMAEKAYVTGTKARTIEEEMFAKLSQMSNQAIVAMRLAKLTSKNVEIAMNVTKATLVEAKNVLKKANQSIPDLGIKIIKDKAIRIKMQSMDISNKTATLLKDHEGLFNRYKKHASEMDGIINNGRMVNKMTINLYDKAKSAYDKAKKAKDDADSLAKEAQETLRILQSFDEEIMKSKKNFTEATKFIPIILSLIKNANGSATAGKGLVDMASATVQDSLSRTEKHAMKLNDTKKLIGKAGQNLDDIKKEYEALKSEVRQTESNITEMKVVLKKYQDKTKMDAKSVQQALQESKQAQEDAKNAEGDLMKALDEVEKLILDLANLDKIDLKKLEDAEKRFKIADGTITGGLDSEVNRLQQMSIKQSELITKYKLDLEPLRKEIAHVNDIYEKIPRRCMKEPPGVETG